MKTFYAYAIQTYIGVAITQGSTCILTLSQDATTLASIIAQTQYNISIDPTGSFSHEIWFNDELNPTGTYYHVQIRVPNVGIVYDQNISITGANFNLAAFVPGSQNIPVAGITLPTFSTNGTPNADQLLLNLVEGANITLSSDSQGDVTLGWTGTLPVASGGTGTSSPATVAGAGIIVSGSFPNQTVTAIGGGFTFTYIGPLAGIPATGIVGQLAFITDATPAGRNIYECASANAWTQQFAAAGSISAVQSLDVSTYAGADLGAKINAAITAAPAAGCILDCRNFASGQTLSTAVNLNGPYKLLASGLVVTQTAAITLSGNGAAVLGTNGKSFIFSKGGNLADQFIISGNDVVIDNVTLNGEIGSSYTGSGILIDSGALRPTISNTTITGQTTDSITDQGSTDLNIFNCYVNTYGVNGYNQTASCQNARITNSMITDTSTTTGSAILLGSGQIEMVGCRVATTGSAYSINSGSSGTININNCHISNAGTTGAGSFIGTGSLATIMNSTLSGGGSSGSPATSYPNVSATNGQIFLIGNLVSGNGAANCIYVSSMSSGHCVITGNQLTQNFQSQGYAILYMTGDSIGNIVTHNSFKMGDNSPTGTNYAIWYHCSGGHAIHFIIDENVIYGGPTAYDTAIYWDNTAIVGTNGGHTVSRNRFIDIGGVCIQRNDPDGYMQTFFENNVSQDGAIFGAVTGDTGGNDTIIQVEGGNSFSSLPPCAYGLMPITGVVGPTAPLRTGSGGSYGVKINGGWSSIVNPTIAQVNTTGITTGTGAIVMVEFAVAGQYLVTWNAKLTTAAGSSSTLGPFLLNWTTPDGVSRGYNACAAQSGAGSATLITQDTGNSTATSYLIGIPLLIDVQGGSNIIYALDLSYSAGSPAVIPQASLNVVVEIR